MNNFGLTMSDIRYVISKIMYKKKKYFLLVLILGLIIGSSLNVVLTLRNSGTGSQSTIQAERASLGEKRASQTESVYQTLTTLQNSLDSINSSSILSTKSKSGVESVLTYYVESRNHADSIVNAVQSMFFTDQLSDQINKKLDTKIDESVLKEYINFDIKDTSINTSNSNNNNNGEDSSNRVFTITIFAKNKSQLSIITNNSTKQIDTIFKKFKKLYANTTYYLLQKSTTKMSESDLLTLRSSLASNVSNISSSMTAIKNTLDADQQTYLNDLLNSGDSTTTVSSSQSATNFSAVKTCLFAVFGALCLAIIYFIILLVFYLLSDKIHSPREIKEALKLTVLSFVKTNEDLEKTVNEVNYYCHENSNNIAVTSTLDSKEDISQMESIAKECSLETINKYPTDKKDFDKLSKINTIILVEKIGVSHTNEIRKLIEYYQDKNIKIDNVVLFEQDYK